MNELDELILKYQNNKTVDIPAKVMTANVDSVSKLAFDPKEQKLETLPNAMVLGDMKEIGVKRIKPQVIPEALLSHPAIERGIEFKFNRMITQLDKHDIGNNIVPKDKSKLAKEAQEYCTEILNNSHNQPIVWIKQFGRDAMRFGDNYALLILNRAGNKVLRLELQNPIFFSPMFDYQDANKTSQVNYAYRESQQLKYRIDPKTKKPSQYTQLKKLSSPTAFSVGINLQNPQAMNFVPTGKIFKANRIVQLNFDRIGDDPFGIPMIQTLWLTLKHILRVEDAGTETMVAFGYNRWVSHTPFRTQEKMQQFGKSIENIAKRSVIILPEGVKLENIKPGSTEFDKVWDILLSLIAMRLGISIVQLKGQGADINKSTLSSMMHDIRNDFFADELEIEAVMNDAFIKACKIRYKLRTTEQIKKFPFPRFSFNEMEEDKNAKSDRLLRQSLSLRNFAFAVDSLMRNGFDKQATAIINNYIDSILPVKQTQEDYKEQLNGLPVKIPKKNSDERER